MTHRELEILEELRATLAQPEQHELITELEALIKKDLIWPDGVEQAAVEMFGAKAADPRQNIHGALDRRIQHCVRLWRDWFGMNPAQSRYAAEVLAHTIRQEGGNRPFTLTALDRLPHDERVHAELKHRLHHLESSEHSE